MKRSSHAPLDPHVHEDSSARTLNSPLLPSLRLADRDSMDRFLPQPLSEQSSRTYQAQAPARRTASREVSPRASVRLIDFEPWFLPRLSFFSRLPRFRARLSNHRIVCARRLLATNNRSVTSNAGVVLADIRFQCHLVKDSYFGSTSDRNARSCRVARTTSNDANVRVGDIQRRHLRYVDVAGGAPQIVIIRFGLAVNR